MASSSYFDNDIHPDESISQKNIDEGMGDDIYREKEITPSIVSAITSTTTAMKKGNLFYVRNEDDKAEAAMLLKVSAI